MKETKSESVKKKLLYILLGFICLITGLVGLLLPVLPGILFLISAVYFFTKASDTFKKIIKKNKTFGKYFK